MMRAAGFASALALFALACATPQPPGAPHAFVSPERVGMSSEALAQLGERMREFEQKEQVSGVVTLVWRRSGVVHADVLGYQDVESQTPMRRDTIFRIASMTKPITSVAVLMLVDEGRLALSDPVERWLPELAEPRVLQRPRGRLDRTRPAARSITVQDLLTHCSGLVYPGKSQLSSALRAEGLDVFSWTLPPDEWLRRLGGLPLAYEPGARYAYGFSTDVLGVLVERVSGMPFAEFLRTRLFEPLGMVDTGFSVPAEKLGRVATLYAFDPKRGAIVATDRPPETALAQAPAFASGGAGLVSTADDYLRFARMLLGAGELDGVRILSRRLWEQMTTNQLSDEQRTPWPGSKKRWPIRGFGFGVSLTGPPAATDAKAAFGGGGAFGTYYFVDPGRELAAVLMVQLAGGWKSLRLVPAFESGIQQAIEE